MLSNTAVPKFYGEFREKVIRGEIPICKEISMEMNRIDELIRDPRYYYDDSVVEGFVLYCEREMTLTDGSDLKLLDTFKLWAEQLLGWFYYVERNLYIKGPNDKHGHYETRFVKKRLRNKQYLIIARGSAKSRARIDRK